MSESKVKKPPTKDPKGRCGTDAGYQRHWHRGEEACDACREAHTVAKRVRARGGTVVSGPSKKPRRPGSIAGTDQDRRRKPEKQWTHETAPTAPEKPPAKPEVPEGVPEPPYWLKEKGLELWVAMTQENEFNTAGLMLLGEACHTVDRLERISAALASKKTMWFELGDLDQVTDMGVPIVMNAMVGEARQLQTTLRQTLNNLGVVNVNKAKAKELSPLDQLAQRRQKRLAAQGEG